MKDQQGKHITANEARAIKAIAALGLKSGRVGRTDYFLTPIEGGWTKVTIEKAVSGDWGPRMERTTVTVQL